MAYVVLIWSRVELQECVFHKLVNLHDCCFVTTPVAIVWSGEDCDDVSIVRPIVPVHDQLMCSSYQLKIVGMVELFTDVLPERVASTSWRNTPTASIIWVRPKEIANWSFSWHFHDSIKLVNLIESINGWRESTMKAEDVVLNNSSKRKVIEKGCEVLPHVGVSVFSQALIIEPINLGNLFGLMISSKDSNS